MVLLNSALNLSLRCAWAIRQVREVRPEQRALPTVQAALLTLWDLCWVRCKDLRVLTPLTHYGQGCGCHYACPVEL